MALRVEFLGTAGYLPIPRPLCDCRVCVEARGRGVPYARSGPSLFVHGPDVLVDTPGEIAEQLNRSTVSRIAACLYSHWHPDHTMGRHVFSPMNIGYPAWPDSPRRVTPIYLPQQVAADARSHLGLWDDLKQMEEQEGVVSVHELCDGEEFELGGVSIRPVRLAEDYAYGFLFTERATRLLVVPDELHRWEPPAELRGVDLAVLPLGVAEFHPLTGERLLAEEHPVLRFEATFEHTLQVARQLAAKRVVLTHIEEAEGLSHDDLAAVAARLNDEGFDLTFAYDTQIVAV